MFNQYEQELISLVQGLYPELTVTPLFGKQGGYSPEHQVIGVRAGTWDFVPTLLHEVGHHANWRVDPALGTDEFLAWVRAKDIARTLKIDWDSGCDARMKFALWSYGVVPRNGKWTIIEKEKGRQYAPSLDN